MLFRSIYGGFTALVYLTPLVGGYLADQYLGSKRAVKFGAIIMSLGYAILCFGGPTATPHATIDGQRYEVSIGKSAEGKEVRYVIDGAKQLEIRGNDDGSVDLLNAGTVERKIAKGSFESGADRSPFYVMVMLIAQTTSPMMRSAQVASPPRPASVANEFQKVLKVNSGGA